MVSNTVLIESQTIELLKGQAGSIKYDGFETDIDLSNYNKITLRGSNIPDNGAHVSYNRVNVPDSTKFITTTTNEGTVPKEVSTLYEAEIYCFIEHHTTCDGILFDSTKVDQYGVSISGDFKARFLIKTTDDIIHWTEDSEGLYYLAPNLFIFKTDGYNVKPNNMETVPYDLTIWWPMVNYIHTVNIEFTEDIANWESGDYVNIPNVVWGKAVSDTNEYVDCLLYTSPSPRD